jgi:hypothetical protein
MRNIYQGIIDSPAEWRVVVRSAGNPDGASLPWRLDVANRSPTGLAWGYPGSGPAQCALALLCYEIGADRALPLYQQFSVEVISRLSQHQGWSMTSADIRAWVEKQKGRDQ